ncbi:MAG: hypothetical protein ACFE7R_02235, partial [Candidatus Hodarchaeota archaeon]
LKEYEDPRQGIIEGARRAFTKCIGLLGIHRLGAFVQLLNEMRDVGLIQMPAPLKVSLNLASLGKMIQDGFLKLTGAGKAFFEGMQKQPPPEEEPESSGFSSVKDKIVD